MTKTVSTTKVCETQIQGKMNSIKKPFDLNHRLSSKISFFIKVTIIKIIICIELIIYDLLKQPNVLL